LAALPPVRLKNPPATNSKSNQVKLGMRTRPKESAQLQMLRHEHLIISLKASSAGPRKLRGHLSAPVGAVRQVDH
jgi:hypothetical protein